LQYYFLRLASSREKEKEKEKEKEVHSGLVSIKQF
jgi:hypothetical protein